MRFLVLLITAFLLSLPATANEFRAPVEDFIVNFVRPKTAQFAQTTSRLPIAVENVCHDTSAETVAEFKLAFAETVQDYSRIHFLRFGPLLENDKASRLAFLPDPRGIVQRQSRKVYAARDETVLTPESLSEKSVALQGLSALELITFDKNTNVRLGEEDDNRAFTCGYALAIARNVATIAKDLAAEWEDPDGYSALLLNTGPENDSYRTSTEALETVFKGLVTGIIIAKDQDVLPALGSSEKKAKPRRFPFSRSANAISYLSNELQAIREGLFAMDLQRFTPEEHAWLLNTLDFEFGNAQVYLKKLEPAVRQTFKTNNNYGDMKALSITLGSIQELMGQELAGALNLAGGFNALDGD